MTRPNKRHQRIQSLRERIARLKLEGHSVKASRLEYICKGEVTKQLRAENRNGSRWSTSSASTVRSPMSAA